MFLKDMSRPLLFLVLLVIFSDVVRAKTNVTSICHRCQCLNVRLYSVDCDNQNLKKVPEIQKDLKVPWRLELHGNSIENVTSFPALKNLTEITFRYNKISRLEEAAFANLTNLRILDLSHNMLTGESLNSEIFRGPFHDKLPDPIPLEDLNLSNNAVNRLPKHVFKHLTNLTSLDLSHNPFFDFSIKTAEALSELQGLKKLSLAFTKLRRLPDHFFAELIFLEELDLSGNDFATVPPEISYAHSLRVLSLNNNIFGTISYNSFMDSLTDLETLNLKDSDTLQMIEDGAFGNLTSLQVLHISGNKQLSIIYPRAFTSMYNRTIHLSELHLENNSLHYLPEGAIKWKSIKYLNLQENPWNCDCYFEWVVKDLVPVIKENNFDLTLHVTCAEPTELLGENVLTTKVQEHKFVCTEYNIHVGRYGFVVVATIVVGTLLLVTGTIIFSYVLFRRSKVHQWVGENVKYRRAMNEDEEIITSTVQY